MNKKNFQSNGEKRISVDVINGVITISKDFEKEARVYKSDAYMTLLEARRANPGFTIQVKTTNHSSPYYKGITIAVMKETMKAANDTIGLEKLEEMTCKERMPYTEIRKWFCAKYPSFIRKAQREAFLKRYESEMEVV